MWCPPGINLTGGSNYDSLFVRTVAFPVQVAYWIKEVIAPCGYSVVNFDQWSGDIVQSSRKVGVRPLNGTATALLSGRDRPRCLCVLRLSGSDRRTGA